MGKRVKNVFKSEADLSYNINTVLNSSLLEYFFSESNTAHFLSGFHFIILFSIAYKEKIKTSSGFRKTLVQRSHRPDLELATLTWKASLNLFQSS